MTMPSQRFSSRWLEAAADLEPVSILIAEHRVTELALNCLERMAERWSGPGRREQLDCQAVQEAIVFFQVFVETWHFRREEIYFGLVGVSLESVEIDDDGTCTFHDHELCSMHLRSIEEAVRVIHSRELTTSSVHAHDAQTALGTFDAEMALPAEVAAAYRKFGKHARAYSDILLRHIENEEDFIYPAIQRRATPDDKQAAVEAFRRASRAAVDWRRIDDCLAIVDRLAERFGAAPQTSSIWGLNRPESSKPGEISNVGPDS